MINPRKMPCQICLFHCQIWPDFAKSWIWPSFQIWVSSFYFNDLMRQFQIWLGCLPNLHTNLDFPNNNRHFCQISDLAKSPPKGVGDLPAKCGKFTTYPLGILLGPEFWAEINPTTATRSAKIMIAVVFCPSSQPKKGDHPWLA